MSLALHRGHRAFEKAFFDDAFGALDRLFTPAPASPLTRSDAGYSLDLALPGLKAEDVSVTLESGVLTLEAERPIAAPEGFEPRRRERRTLSLKRSFRLPADADADGITASMTDGIFHLELPLAAAASPRTIAVTDGADA